MQSRARLSQSLPVRKVMNGCYRVGVMRLTCCKYKKKTDCTRTRKSYTRKPVAFAYRVRLSKQHEYECIYWRARARCS